MFNVPFQFPVNLEVLERTYKQLQKQLHPDKFSSKSETEQRHSASHAARLNEAYSILRDPYLRAIYMLRRQGHRVDEEGDTVVDPELLSEVMDTREAIAMARSVAELRALDARISEWCVRVEAELAQAFARNDPNAAREATRRLAYIRRMREALKEKMPSS